MNHIRMKDLPEDQRPYEKCSQAGCASLTDAELLAIILRTGSGNGSAVELARAVLSCNSAGVSRVTSLATVTREELLLIPGIGPVKAAQILCIGELCRRISRSNAREELSMDNPQAIAGYYMEDLRFADRENCIAMMLDSKNHFIGDQLISVGTVNASLLSAREIFLEALKKGAVFVVLIHNHPSGNPAPSPEDLALTEQVVMAGRLIGIELIDHIIIGDRCYYSMMEEGYIG